MTRRRAAAVLAGGASALLVLPATAAAHGFVGRQDLPIPRWLFAWAAAVVLVASFVALAVLWREPRLEGTDAEQRPPLLRLPARPFEVLFGLVGVGLFVLLVAAGFDGAQTTQANIAPTLLFIFFWVGVPVLSLLVGDVWRLLSPWRAVGRAVGWAVGRLGGDATPEPLAYPARLGRWPAVLTILAFAWVELAWGGRDDPSNLAVIACAYAAVQLVGMSLFGVEPWTRNADGFAVWFGMVARLAPVRWVAGAVHRQRALSGVTRLDPTPGTVALLIAVVGTTTFDGFTQGPTWSSIVPDVQNAFVDLGFSQLAGLEAALTAGMLVIVLLVGLFYRLGVSGMRGIRGASVPGARLEGHFVHSLVPIAMAYVVAHYFSLLFVEGQRIAYLASDPFGTGADLLGTAAVKAPDYSVFGANTIWYVQVGALVLGHVGGLVLAHDRALVTWKDGRAATRSQYWMLAVMVGFTSLALWLLSPSG